MLSSTQRFTDRAFPRLIRYLIWIGSEQEKTFGPTISGLIYHHLWPDRVCMWDSKARGAFVPPIRMHTELTSPSTTRSPTLAGGRPDIMKLIKDAYHSWNAEVVFITSNWQGNRELMEGCKEAGIPAFVRSLSHMHACPCPGLTLAPCSRLQGTLWDF